MCKWQLVIALLVRLLIAYSYLLVVLCSLSIVSHCLFSTNAKTNPIDCVYAIHSHLLLLGLLWSPENQSARYLFTAATDAGVL
jgi:hypothetical protein